MVEFNGAALEAISQKIRILDVLVGAPAVNVTTINPALRDGDIFARRLWGPRAVEVSFVVMEPDETARALILSDVIQWAYTAKEAALRVPQQPGAYLTAACSGVPNDSAREWWEPIGLTFRAADPFFQADMVKSAAVGASFTVERAAGANWRIEQTVGGTLAQPAWASDGGQLTFASITAGKLVIRSRDQTALLDGASVLPSLLLGSRFPVLNKGSNTITGSNGAGGTIYWRERWI